MTVKDVELVIRARDEAGKTVKAFTNGLKELVGVQGDLSTSAKRTDSVLGQLGQELTALNQQVQDLSAFGKVVSSLDKAAAAVDRLEGRVAQASNEYERLNAKQAEAAATASKAKAAAEGAAAAYAKQADQAASVRREAGKTSDAYKDQAAALDLAKASRDQANAALRVAEREEKALSKSLVAVSQQLTEQSSYLEVAKGEWQGLYDASQSAGRLLGGVAASQDEVAAASARAAEKLSLAKGAMDFQQEAAGAKRLREAAEYVRFWTAALNEKDAAEDRARAQRSADMFAQATRDAQAAADFMETYQSRLNATLGVQEKFTNSAKASFEVFAQAGRTEDQMAAATERLRAQVNPLTAVQANLNKELAKARDLYRAGYISAHELAEAEKVLAHNADIAAKAMGHSNVGGGKGGGSLFGLKPYELHSLSYQINDVITQLGSGTPVLQVVAQQGGQVFQVFQRQLVPALARVGPVVAAWAPQIALGVAAFGTLVAVGKNVSDLTQSYREFSGELTINADGALYNAKALAQTAHQLDVYGGSLADTRTALSSFTKEGVNPAVLEDFGRAAQDLADVTGKELPTAAAEMSKAFTGGFDQIAKMDDELNFLTAAERSNIKAMFESGRAAEARTKAFDIFSGKMNEGARNMRGPWAESVRNFAQAWDGFLTFIKDSGPVQYAIDKIGELSQAAKDLTDKLPGADERAAEMASGAGAAETIRIEKQIADLRDQRAKAAEREARASAKGGGLLTGDKDYNLRAPNSGAASKTTGQIDSDIAALEQRLVAVKKDAADTIAKESEARTKAQNEVIKGLERQRETLGDLSDQQKITLAGEKAYRDSMLATGDAVIAQSEKQLAIDKEIERQRQAINFGALSGKIAGIESSGNANAKNPNSSATGLGQFIESTWIRLFKENFPRQAADMSKQAILDLRKDADVSKKMIELYARENASVLQKAGVAVNEAAVYLAHFLGPKGAERILKAAPKTPTSQLLGADAINANASILKGKTAGDVVGFAQRKVGTTDAARGLLETQAQLAESIRKSAEAAQKAQDSFNDAVDDENTKRERAASNQKALNGLTGEALIAEQRRVAIADAVAAGIEKAAEASDAEIRAGREAIALSEAQKAAIERTSAAKFDAEHEASILAARQHDVETALNALLERRQSLFDAINLAQQQGDGSQAESLLLEYDNVNQQIASATQGATDFWTALAGDPAKMAMLGLTAQQIQNIILGLQNASNEAKNFNNQFLATGQQINQQIAQGAVNAFDKFSESVAEGKNVFKSAGDAFRQFAADFLRQIAQMIIQQAILNALGGGATGGSGVGGGIAGFIGKLFHSGGVVGRPGGQSRAVSPTWFANAPRYHNGGIAGLKPGEVPAILKKNEEVLTEDSPRNILNGGGGGAASAPVVKIVNALDVEDTASKVLNSRAGEQGVLNIIRTNPSVVAAAAGGGR